MLVFLTLVFIWFFLILFIFLITLALFSCILSTLSIIAYNKGITVVFGLMPCHSTIPAIFTFDIYSALQSVLFALFFSFLFCFTFFSFFFEKYFLPENFILNCCIDIICTLLSLYSISSSSRLLPTTLCQIWLFFNYHWCVCMYACSPLNVAYMYMCLELTTWFWITIRGIVSEKNTSPFLSSCQSSVALHLGVEPCEFSPSMLAC